MQCAYFRTLSSTPLLTALLWVLVSACSSGDGNGATVGGDAGRTGQDDVAVSLGDSAVVSGDASVMSDETDGSAAAASEDASVPRDIGVQDTSLSEDSSVSADTAAADDIAAAPAGDISTAQDAAVRGDAAMTSDVAPTSDAALTSDAGSQGDAGSVATDTVVEAGDGAAEETPCEECLASGGTWQPEANACTENCDYMDISCYTTTCPEPCSFESCGTCHSSEECEKAGCTWHQDGPAMWCTFN